jgi:hypothetical protein
MCMNSGKERDTSFSTASRPIFGPATHPMQRIRGVLSPEVSRWKCEIHHSPPTTNVIKNSLLSPSFPVFFSQFGA